MESENLTIIEQLEKLRITSSSEIPPHEFLYTWNGVPCFARGELVAVTGKAKSGKTYLNSILMAAGTSALSRGAGNELEPASNAGLTDKGHFLGLERIREKPLRVVWIDTEQSADSTHEILRDRIGAMMGSCKRSSSMAEGNTYYNANRNFLTRIPEPVSTAYVPL